MASPELAFVAQCCRSAFNEEIAAAGSELATLDWKRFADLARFHRVTGLAWAGLRQRIEVPDTFAVEAKAVAADNLRVAAEMRALRDAFEAARTPFLFVKGLALAGLIYPEPLLKMGWDIDLLVEPADIGKAAGLLAAQGYSLVIPSSRQRLAAWHSSRKESLWRRGNFHVELHSRLVENASLIPSIGVHSPSQRVEIVPGIAVSTLADDELFAHLCVHGASSLWFRLKWIVDLAAFLSRRGRDEIEGLYRTAIQLGAGRTAAFALLLADEIFGTLADSDLAQEVRGDRVVRWLARRAICQMASSREPTGRPGGTLAIHYTQLFLRSGIGFKVAEVARQVRAARMRP